jgi:predicted MFS family arabinose efflux permease
MACVPVAAALGVLRLEGMYAVAFLAGTLTVFIRLSATALLPSLVGRRHLLEANGALLGSFALAQIAGPSIAGVLVQVVAPPVVLVVDALSFVVSAVCFSLLREPPAGPRRKANSSLLTEISEGLRWLRASGVLFRLTVAIGLANLAMMAVQAVLVPFATAELGLSPALLGLAVGAMGPMSLLGAVLAARLARLIGLGPTLIWSLSGELLSRIVLLAAGGPPLVSATVLGVSHGLFGFIAPLWDVNANSLRQSMTPERLLGRVSSASAFVGMGTAPIGALLGGWIGEAAGPRTTLLFGALVTVLALACVTTPSVLRLRAPVSRSLEEAV